MKEESISKMPIDPVRYKEEIYEKIKWEMGGYGLILRWKIVNGG